MPTDLGVAYDLGGVIDDGLGCWDWLPCFIRAVMMQLARAIMSLDIDRAFGAIKDDVIIVETGHQTAVFDAQTHNSQQEFDCSLQNLYH